MATATAIEQVKIADLRPYKRNAKIHGEEQVQMIADSIQEFGFVSPCLIDRDMNLIAGHGRVEAAKRLGMTDVPCVYVEGLTDEQRRAYILADNRLGELAEWDMELVQEELAELADLGFDVELTGFELLEEGEEPEAQEDGYSEEDAENAPTRCQPGDIWQLGKHRLICGDCTDPAVIAELMDGEKADLVFTDPPYNVASDSKNFAADVSRAYKELAESDWDKNFEIEPALSSLFSVLADDVSVYICTQHFLAGQIWEWMKTWSEHYSYCVWAKPNPMPSLAKRHWTWNTELICYATRGKHVFNFPDEGHALSTWTINKNNERTGHPTEKPVAVPAMAISHSSRENALVLDTFGGSGSTLIACEQLNRKCYMSELDPHYCDVIIDRWEKFTEEKAVKI